VLTEDQLKAIMPRMAKNPRTCAGLYPQLLAAMQEAQITTPQRQAAFLAQVALESGEFRYMAEVWGPTAQQLRYDPPTTLAKRLGNIHPGDGFRYRGAGPIQLTGRENFRRAGQALGLDLEGSPELAHTPAVGFRIAAWYWTTRNLNALSDQLTLDPDQDITPGAVTVATARTFDKITLKINGGFNGRDIRNSYYRRACQVLKP
jgi:predicted chitinase